MVPQVGEEDRHGTALGYAAVFGAATNTLLAPVLIGAEVFGFAYLPHFFVVCTVAYLFNMDKSIYALQEVGYRGDGTDGGR